jgi:flavorubredoxin
MYGNTEQMAEAVAQGLVRNGIKNVVMHNVAKSDASIILSDIFKYKGLVIGGPTYSNELHPDIHSLLTKIELRQVKNRDFGFFGSFSWAGVSGKKLAEFGENMKWRMVDDRVEEKMALKKDNYLKCLDLGKNLAGLLRTSEA